MREVPSFYGTQTVCRKKILYILLTLVCAYCSSYLCVRFVHIIVHYRTYRFVGWYVDEQKLQQRFSYRKAGKRIVSKRKYSHTVALSPQAYSFAGIRPRGYSDMVFHAIAWFYSPLMSLEVLVYPDEKYI